MLLAFAAARFLARRSGVSWVEPFATLGICGVAAIVGARAWALIEWWWVDRDITWIWDPLAAAGYSSPGAFLGAGAVLLVARAIFGRAQFASIVDVVVPSALIALAMARLGCVFERCDPGRPTSLFGVTYPDGAQLHPFGAYVAIGTLIAVVVVSRGQWPVGKRAVVVTLAYAAVRFAAEFTRDAATLIHAGHAVAVAVAIIAAAWWAIDGRRASAS